MNVEQGVCMDCGSGVIDDGYGWVHIRDDLTPCYGQDVTKPDDDGRMVCVCAGNGFTSPCSCYPDSGRA